MLRTRIWLSIFSWALLAVITAVASYQIAIALYPSMHPGLGILLGIFAVQAIYSLRSFARRRGWAIASYAPDE